MDSLRSTPASMPIPTRLNFALTAVVCAAGISLLWLASSLESWWAIAGVGVAFSYLMLTNYALLHEAAHLNLHGDGRINYALGVITGLLFPVPFTMLRIAHQGHHLRNRTDFEMFDQYYSSDIKVVRFAQWYSILCGLFYPVLPVGAVLFCLCPGLVNLPIFVKARSSRHLLGDIGRGAIWRIRAEVLAIIGFFALLFWLLELRWECVLVCYACAALNWSTRQYVSHAFTRRHVVEGAWNLKHTWLMSWLLLHGEYDLNHHRHPETSWYYLPDWTRPEDPRPSYIAQYWRQWLGPRRATEPAPESLTDLPLTVDS
ncbi:MAG: fatty acid desaturase [Planctomycetes bacterium]|nr:fatty acid desaturase [Planctomycetota bacterium]